MATSKIACKLGEGSKTLFRLPELAAPALKICLPTAIKQQQQHESFQRSTGRSSTTLTKYPDLRIVLVSMKAKTKMREHKAAGRLSLLTLTGCVRSATERNAFAVADAIPKRLTSTSAVAARSPARGASTLAPLCGIQNRAVPRKAAGNQACTFELGVFHEVGPSLAALP